MAIQTYVFFCDQTHGRTNQLPIKIIFFSFEKLWYNKTNNDWSLGWSRVSIDLGCASVNRNSWGSDPESLRANRSAYYPRDQ